MDSMDKTTTDVRNIRSYLLTALYRAPTSIVSKYKAEVNHNMYGRKIGEHGIPPTNSPTDMLC